MAGMIYPAISCLSLHWPPLKFLIAAMLLPIWFPLKVCR